MAKRARSVEIVETDRVEGFAHPREAAILAGHADALARAARAIRRGRPPQAWLITGPPGIGKATLAYRIARYLLAHGATAEGPDDLSVPDNSPVAQQVAAGSHPGLLVLKRGINPETGKLMTVLSVGEIRRLGGFFGMTSGAGGWRVAIIDTADDMNEAAANALLKLLEEPPSRAMLLLVANVPGRLLPTIRSRCQRLELRPLDEATMEAQLKRLLPDADAKQRTSLVRLSGGSLGLALKLAGGEGTELAAEADRLIDRATSPDVSALLAFADKLSRMTDGLEDFGAFLTQALAERIRAKAGSGARLDRWVAAWEALNRSFARSTALHLDPRQTVLGAARTLGDAARRAGTV
ncbi:MAG: DNA polymerase III subunit delta' [Alphaproteobacteria bacterium]|nr:DNA polymerase III subunit delta' [Alphaproteobacteria bacterium]MBV9692104.1 DNA polymerase III subunit delta' [Alphaproteobacteria bacterium]